MTNAVPRILKGRTPIFTSVETLSLDNINDELTKAMAIHRANREDIQYLINYHLGDHSILYRIKNVREDIDNKVVINYAQSTTRDITGYYLGKPIQYVCRTAAKREAVKEFSDAAVYENKDMVDYQVAEFQSICGVGYKAIFPDIEDDEVPFELASLDPRNTFVVYSTELGNRPVWACAYHTVTDANDVKWDIFNIYDKERSFIVKAMAGRMDFTGASFEDKGVHLLKGLPIIEFQNNQWRIGDWETSIALMDAIDTLASDSVNDISQFVQSFLAIIGAELPDAIYDENNNLVSDPLANMKQNRLINIFAAEGNGNIEVKYIANNLDPTTSSSLREYLETSLRVVLGVPDRKTRGGGGGDTGDAVYMRDGWQDIDLVASTKETYAVAAEKDVIRLMLHICQEANQFLDLSVKDIDVKFSRNKSANGVSKANMYSILVGTNTLTPQDALEMADLTTDTEAVIKRGEAYQEKKAEKAQAMFEAQAAASNPDGDSKEVGQTDATKDGGADELKRKK